MLSFSKLLIYSVYLMILSYFYNISVLSYSIKGDNELRLYDLAGILVFYLVFKKSSYFYAIIKKHKTFLYFFYFLIWATFSLIFTFAFSISLGKFKWGLQSTLYVYHFWIFYLTAVFLYTLLFDLNQTKKIVHFVLILSIIAFLIVILQNFDVIPFLWSDIYLKSYNFYSGTLGPNKIVLGMTCFMIFALSIGLYNEKRVKINSTLLLIATGISLLTLIISGSRTSYVALLIFLGYFFIKKTKSFIKTSSVLFVLFIFISLINRDVLDKSMEVFQNRVENKIDNPNALREGNIDELYEDLGSGRKGLSLMYIEYLLENPYIIPFGVGFNNRLILQSSAHNMYLSLINELGLFGFFLFFRWLYYHFWVKVKYFPNLDAALGGLILAMAVTLFFGEHLYVYRPLFGLFGLFILVITILQMPNFVMDDLLKNNKNNV